MLAYGDLRELSEEELARAVRLDPSQIAGLGPSLESLMEMLRQRKQKILETYETERVQQAAAKRYSRVRPENAAALRNARHVSSGLQRGATIRPGTALVSGRQAARAISPGSLCT